MHNKIRKDSGRKKYDETIDDNASHNLSSMDLEMNQEIPIDDPSQVVLHKEMFLDVTSEDREIRLNADFLDFNFTHVGRISDSRQLTM